MGTKPINRTLYLNDLIVGQIPAHSHGGIPSMSDVSRGTGNASASRTISSVQSGSTGGGGPHNNLPPEIVVNFVVRAR